MLSIGAVSAMRSVRKSACALHDQEMAAASIVARTKHRAHAEASLCVCSGSSDDIRGRADLEGLAVAEQLPAIPVMIDSTTDRGGSDPGEPLEAFANSRFGRSSSGRRSDPGNLEVEAGLFTAARSGEGHGEPHRPGRSELHTVGEMDLGGGRR